MRCWVVAVGQFGQIAAGDSAQFGADQVRGESRAEQAAIDSGDLALVQRAANVREPAFQARTDEFDFARLGEDGIECSVYQPIRHAAPSQLADDAKSALSAKIGMLSREFERVARIVKIIVLTEARDDLRDGVFIFRAALKIPAHFVDRVGAAHERAESGVVKFLLAFELAER